MMLPQRTIEAKEPTFIFILTGTDTEEAVRTLVGPYVMLEDGSSAGEPCVDAHGLCLS